MAAAVRASPSMFWCYGVVPHQWLTYAGNELSTGASTRSWSAGAAVHRPRGCSSTSAVHRQQGEHAATSSSSASTALVPHPARVRSGRSGSNRAKTGRCGPRAHLAVRPSPGEAGVGTVVASTDANPPMPEFRSTDYVLQEVVGRLPDRRRSSRSSSSTSTSPSASCARAASTSAPGSASTWSPTARSSEAVGIDQPGVDPTDHVDLHHRRRRVHPLCAVRRPLPDGRDHPRQAGRPRRRRRPPPAHQHPWLRLSACEAG